MSAAFVLGAHLKALEAEGGLAASARGAPYQLCNICVTVGRKEGGGQGGGGGRLRGEEPERRKA